MLEILAADDPDITVSDIERRAGLKPSYSYEIMKLLEKEFPGAVLQLLIGGDSLTSLHTWHNAKKIVADYELICCPRRGCEPDREELAKHWTPKEIDILLQCVLQMPFFDISSTAVRESIRNGAEPKKMNKKLLEYINKQGLYREIE
jgi:nicotinate-nucleotide adenylyltransferase